MPVRSKNIDLCVNILKDKKLSIAFAESATAGRVMADFSLVENAGNFLKGGVVCYDVSVKENVLNVSPLLISEFTAESAEVTEAAATGLRTLIQADVHVAVTGLTSPGGSETASKPVGTMFVHFLYLDMSQGSRAVFEGDSESIIDQTVDYIAVSLRHFLPREKKRRN